MTETDKVVTKFGTQGDNAYFHVENRFSGGYLYDVVYVLTTNNFGKFAYVQLLTAKALNTLISRIDYAKNASDVCILTLIEIAD